jgi:hypothetical protein
VRFRQLSRAGRKMTAIASTESAVSAGNQILCVLRLFCGFALVFRV